MSSWLKTRLKSLPVYKDAPFCLKIAWRMPKDWLTSFRLLTFIEKWEMTEEGTIKSFQNTNYCIDENGLDAIVIITPCNGSSNQKWTQWLPLKVLMKVMSLSDFSETVCWKLNPMWFIRVTILDDVLMSAFTGLSLSD